MANYTIHDLLGVFFFFSQKRVVCINKRLSNLNFKNISIQSSLEEKRIYLNMKEDGSRRLPTTKEKESKRQKKQS